MMEFIGSLNLSEMTDTEVVIWIGYFFGALMIFEGLRQFLGRPSTEAMARNRRIRMQQRGEGQEEILAALTLNDAVNDKKGGSSCAAG